MANERLCFCIPREEPVSPRLPASRPPGLGVFLAALMCVAAIGVGASPIAEARVAGTPRVDADRTAKAPSLATAQVAGKVAESQETKTILFLGDSLTAGYGLPPEQAFPSLIGQRLRELDLPFTVISAGVPGETSAGGLRRIDWLLRRPVDILVLELGANDMLRGLPLDLTRQNLQSIIDKTRAANPDVKIVVAGMLAPPNLGPEYATEFREVFPALADANGAVLIPFLLQDVAARPDLNLADGIHPNAAGQRIVAEGVWAAIEQLLDGRDGVAAAPRRSG